MVSVDRKVIDMISHSQEERIAILKMLDEPQMKLILAIIRELEARIEELEKLW